MNLFLLEIDPYAGPLDLLLYLIREKRLTIEEVRLVQIADQYLLFLEQMKTLDLTVASSYLVVAATLIHIKSRFLLPGQRQEEGDSDEADLKDQLMERIRQNLLFKQAAERLDRQPRLYREHFPRPDQSRELEETNITWLRPTTAALVDAFRKALMRSAKRIVPTGKGGWRPLRVHIRSMVDRMTDRFGRKQKLSLVELSESLVDDRLSLQHSLILSFLGMLQMTACGMLHVVQKAPLEPVWMEAGPAWDRAQEASWQEEVESDG